MVLLIIDITTNQPGSFWTHMLITAPDPADLHAQEISRDMKSLDREVDHPG